MADKNVDIVISAEDQASSVLQRIGNNINNMTSSTMKAGSSMSGFSSSVSSSLNNVSKSWGNLTTKIQELPGILTAATGIGIGAIASMGIESAAAVESSRAAFVALTGSAEKANEIILKVQDAAKSTPFDQAALIKMNQSLVGAGMSADVAFKTVLQLGDALAATGGGTVELQRAGATISQVFGKGKADAVDFKELVNAGWVTVRKDVSQSMGLTMAQFEEAVSAGKVGFTELSKVMTNKTKDGYKNMEAQTTTFKGIMSNFIDTMNIELGKAFTDTGAFESMKSALMSLTSGVATAMPVIVQGFKDVSAVLSPIVKTIGAILSPFAEFIKKHQELQRVLVAVAVGFTMFIAAVAILAPIFMAISAIMGVVGATFLFLATLLPSMATVMAVLSVAMSILLGPIGLIILGIAALVAIGYLLVRNWHYISASASSIFSAIKSMIIAAGTAIVGVWEYISTAVSNAFTAMVSFIGIAVDAVVVFFTQTIPGALVAFISFVQAFKARVNQFFYDLFVTYIPYAVGFALSYMYMVFTVGIPAAINAFIAFVTETIPATIMMIVMWFIMLKDQTILAFNNLVTASIALFESMRVQAIEKAVSMRDGVVAWIENMRATITDAINKLPGMVTTAFTMAKDSAINLAKTTRDGVFKWIEDMRITITDAIKKIPGMVTTAFTQAKDAAISIAQSLHDGVKGWIDKVVGLFQNLIGKASEAIGKAREAFSLGMSGGKSSFQHGGVIPGSFNQAVPAVLHGGERVISRTGTDVNTGGGGSGSGTVNVIIEGDVNSMDTLNKIVEAVKASLGRDNELAQLGVST